MNWIIIAQITTICHIHRLEYCIFKNSIISHWKVCWYYTYIDKLACSYNITNQGLKLQPESGMWEFIYLPILMIMLIIFYIRNHAKRFLEKYNAYSFTNANLIVALHWQPEHIMWLSTLSQIHWHFSFASVSRFEPISLVKYSQGIMTAVFQKVSSLHWN